MKKLLLVLIISCGYLYGMDEGDGEQSSDMMATTPPFMMEPSSSPKLVSRAVSEPMTPVGRPVHGIIRRISKGSFHDGEIASEKRFNRERFGREGFTSPERKALERFISSPDRRIASTLRARSFSQGDPRK